MLRLSEVDQNGTSKLSRNYFTLFSESYHEQIMFVITREQNISILTQRNLGLIIMPLNNCCIGYSVQHCQQTLGSQTSLDASEPTRIPSIGLLAFREESGLKCLSVTFKLIHFPRIYGYNFETQIVIVGP